MAFSPGIPSTGSTSACWTALLAAGYFLHLPFLFWTVLWGCIFTVATAYTAAYVSYIYFGSFRNATIVGILCILEWHLAWSAVSGMEISLFTSLSLLFLLFLYRDSAPYFMELLAGLLLVIGPWMILNFNLNGRPFPATISSKIMQYGFPVSAWKSLKYLGKCLPLFFERAMMLLVPGAGSAIYQAIRQRRTDLYYALGWSLTLILIYALALPAIYDRGRYLMPLIPILAIFGIEGLALLFHRLQLNRRLQTVVWVAIGAIVIVLWINGATTFALQVKLPSENHARVAHWVDEHTPKEAMIVTHDIGLIGYITQQQIVDLAGLVTSEVIPTMSDQEKLADYVRDRNVIYVIVFTGYYPEFLKQLNAQLIYSPNKDEFKSRGLEPFEVFQIPP